MDFGTPAEKARLRGNELYKSGRLHEALECYHQAHDLDPQQSAPLSNLAATSFELGDYTSSNDYADKALALLRPDAASHKSKARLLVRKLRALILLRHFAEARELAKGDDAADCAQDDDWHRLTTLLSEANINDHTGPTEYSPFKPMVGDFSQTEVVGDDKPTSIFDTSLISPERKDASLLFINAGDARNVFATLLHIADPAINTGTTRFLFTLADTNPYNSARFLVVMSMLHQLKDGQHDPATSEVLATLFHTYISPTIPTHLYSILQQHIRAVLASLDEDELPDYIGAEHERTNAIKNILGFWLERAQDHFPPAKVRRTLDEDLLNATGEDLEFYPVKIRQEARAFRMSCHLQSGLRESMTDLPVAWQTNVTLINDTASALQGLVFDPFKFGSLIATAEVSDDASLAELVNAWFIKIAQALRALQDKIILTVRGLPANLPYHGHGSARSATTQRLYDRIHLSDLPDLAGGTLYVYSYAVPLLTPASTSYVTWKCSAYATQFISWNEYDLEFLAIAGDRKGQIARQLFGVRPDNDVYDQAATSYLFDSTSISGYRRARSALVPLKHTNLMPRDRLVVWLHRIMLKTALPHAAEVTEADDVLSPFNTSMFITVLNCLHAIGYPAHWLSGVVTDMLEGLISTTARPPLSRPLRVKEVNATLSTRTLDISFLAAELAQLSSKLSFGIAHGSLSMVCNTRQYSVKLPDLGLQDSVFATYALLISPHRAPDTEEETKSLSLSKQRASRLADSHMLTIFSLSKQGYVTFRWLGPQATTAKQISAHELLLMRVEPWVVCSRASLSQASSST